MAPVNMAIDRYLVIRQLGPPGSGMSWGKYPFASSAEGGTNSSVELVPQIENWYQGGLVMGAIC